jgi:arylsulfate sulfotransferase
VPVFQLDENTMTAQVISERNLAPIFSLCCGNASILSNGDLEYDIAFDGDTPNHSNIQETTANGDAQPIWQMTITDQLAYRGFRIPSLYPGVSWSQAAIASANATAKPALRVASSK